MKITTFKISFVIIIQLILFFSQIHAQNTLISPGLRRVIAERTDSGLYHSIVLAVIDGENEEILVMNNSKEKISTITPINISGLYPLLVSLQFADMIGIGASPETLVNDLLEKDKKIKSKLGRKIILKDLALNTSGMSKSIATEKSACKEDLLNMPGLSECEFDFIPGTIYSQKNNDLILLSNLLLKKYGLPCELYFNDHLFRKLNLSNTIVVDGIEIPGFEKFTEAGTFVSTTEDLISLARIQLGQKNKKFHTDLQGLRKYSKETRFKNNLVGAGWFVYQSDRGIFYYQQTRREKINVLLIFEPEQKKAVVVAANSEIPLDDIAWHIMTNESLKTFQEKRNTDIQISKYVGEYTNNGEEVVSIIKTENSLLAFFNGEESHICYPCHDNTFSIAIKGIEFRFVLNENDEAEALFIDGYSTMKYYRLY